MKKIIIFAIALMISNSVLAQSALEEYRSRQISIDDTSVSGAENTISSVPSGAVMAFDLGGNCPAGWTLWKPAAGRVVIGSGSLDNINYKTRDYGGNNNLVITPKNIERGRTVISGLALKIKEDKTAPYVMVADTSVVTKKCIDREEHCTRYPPRPYTIDFGEEKADPADNRQPYVVLTYCKKI